ncbi:MAG: hypothetical protein GC189_11445 [Alphaproteobacteria bacterium]|nr:hypothetical protein [Alphaproteobacteria bacterium]
MRDMHTKGRFALVGLALLLAACGFQPLYAPQPGDGPGIGNVQIATVPGRAGHTLRTELDRLLRIGAQANAPTRTLDILLQEDIANLGIRTDESATRADLRLTARYTLSSIDNRPPLVGTTTSVVSYEIPTAAFGEIAAQDDARERAAETLAQRIRADLVLRLANQDPAS